MTARKIRVLIVDDSAIVRKILTEAIAAEPDIEVIATAPDAYIARDKILSLRPDVIILDLEMPRMDGLTFLKNLMFLNPIPTLVVSSQGQNSGTATLEALRCGAVDVVPKPATPHALRDLRRTLAAKIRGAAGSHPRPATDVPPSCWIEAPVKASILTVEAHPSLVKPASRLSQAALPVSHTTPVMTDFSRSLIAIGASTGGTAAIQEILVRLPAEMPPILVTQHIPSGFSSAFAERLNRICALEVREATSGDLLRPGLALLAPGDHHLLVHNASQGMTVELDRGPEVCYLRPSVDTMFFSIAESVAASSTIAVLLTGMGLDGARGMLALKKAGAATVAQDEGSCVVYGMPREAMRLGAAETIAPLSSIAALLIHLSRTSTSTAVEPDLHEALS